jgi:short-subunit dehydrogenase
MKNIIITGTSRGIGYEMVRILAEDQEVSILALSRTAQPINALGIENVTAIPFNLTKPEDLKEVTDFVEQEWNSQVDILVHNAGKMLKKPFEKIQLAELKKVFDVNIFGVFELTKTVLPFMNSNGHIVMNSTMGAVQGSVKFAGLSAYSSSKAALINLTEVLAEELKEKGPAVNCLAFGAVQTEMFEEAFPGGEAPVSAEEMADYVIDFALKGNRLYNGKLLQISNSTP